MSSEREICISHLVVARARSSNLTGGNSTTSFFSLLVFSIELGALCVPSLNLS